MSRFRFNSFRDWNSIEQISYWLIWLVMFFLPLIFWDFSDPMHKRRIAGGWIRILPFFVIFLIHNYVLLPQLLLKKKYLSYAIITILAVLLINYIFIINDFLHRSIIDLMGIEKPDFDKATEHFPQRKFYPRGDSFRDGRPWRGYRGGRYGRWQFPLGFAYTYNVLISVLIVGFNIAIRNISLGLKRERERKELEKVNALSQLNMLQSQISPHFFMNTLNNIHALIDYDKNDAKDAILRLSRLMRYLLYESDQGKTSLKKELEFMRSYIDLMQIRLQPDVDLKVNFPDTVPDMELYALIPISFLENAFKHGIDPRKPSYIHILLELKEGIIHFNVKNGKPASTESKTQPGGFGIKNTRRRLDLLFGESYSLNIYDRDKEFEVDLIYPSI